MSSSSGLSDVKQAIAVFFAAVIATIAGWAAAGFPTDKLAIGAVVAAILLGAGLAIKEVLGTSTTTTSTPTPAPTSASKTSVTPIPIFRMRRRLMFLSLRN